MERPYVMAIAKHPLTHVVVADQCMYGLLSPTPGGGELPAIKPTRFLTSSPEMAARLSTRCSKDHQHQQLVGGRAAAAAFYPLKLIKAMLLGMRDTADAKSKLLDQARESRDVVNAVSDSAGAVPGVAGATTIPLTSQVPFVKGKMRDISYDDCNFRAKYGRSARSCLSPSSHH